MILVDTSIWIDHLRRSNEELVSLLYGNLVLMHPCVLGELACGNLESRTDVLKLLTDLPAAATASHAEALYFIEQHSLMGRGIGYIDAHLLASVLLTSAARIWTRDRRLGHVAGHLDLDYSRPSH